MNISIPNVTITEKYYNGDLRGYDLAPNAGYVLHDADADNWDVEGNIVPAYSSGSCSCGKNYDFSTTKMSVPDINGNMVTVTAYGARQFFVLPAVLVPDPKNNIYGGGENAFVEQIKAEERGS